MANNEVDVNINVKGGDDIKNGLGDTKTLAKDVGDQFGLMNTQVGKLAGGVLKFGKTAVNSMKTLKGAIISTGIGALVIAVVALISYFSKTEKGAQKLRVAMAAVGQVVATVTDTFIKIGETLVKIGSIIGKVVKGNVTLKEGFSEATEVVKEGAKEIVTSYENIGEAVKKATDLEDRANKLRVDNRKNLVTEAELLTKLSDARRKTGDQLLTNAERITALTEAQNINNKIFDEKVRLAEEAYNIQKEQNALSESTEEDMEKEAQLQADLILLQAERNNRNKEFHDQRAGLIKAENTLLEQQAAKEQANLDKKAEEEAKALEKKKADDEKAKAYAEEKAQQEVERAISVADQIAIMEQENAVRKMENAEQAALLQLEFDKENFEIDLQRQLENEEITQQELEAIRAQYDEGYVASKAAINATILEDEKATVKAKIDMAKIEAQQKIDGALTAANAMLGAADAVFGESKATAIAGTIISTYQSATSAFNALAGIPVVGPVLGGIAAGAAVIAGIANVNKIKNEKKPSAGGELPKANVPNQNPIAATGGYLVGPSHSQGGIDINAEGGEGILSKATMSTQLGQAAMAQNNGGNVNFATLEDVVGLINAQEVYIVESKLTKKQKDVQIRESSYTK